MPPLLVFDLDGTLADTAPDLLGATNAVLKARGRAPIDPQTLRHMVGFGARSLITQALVATGSPPTDAELPELVEIFLAHYREHIADGTVLFPNVRETLDHLRAKGSRLGILTNKPQALTDLLLPRLGFGNYFDAVYGAGRKTYGKPDPRIFHDLIADMSASSGGGSAAMVGDSITDLETGRAARVPVILTSYGYTPKPARELGADAVIDDFAELPGALAQLGFL